MISTSGSSYPPRISTKFLYGQHALCKQRLYNIQLTFSSLTPITIDDPRRFLLIKLLLFSFEGFSAIELLTFISFSKLLQVFERVSTALPSCCTSVFYCFAYPPSLFSISVDVKLIVNLEIYLISPCEVRPPKIYNSSFFIYSNAAPSNPIGNLTFNSCHCGDSPAEISSTSISLGLTYSLSPLNPPNTYIFLLIFVHIADTLLTFKSPTRSHLFVR